MAEMHHKVREAVKCEISGCENLAVRSLPTKKIASIISGTPQAKRRTHLCKEHYKQYRKKTRKDRELETLTWD